MIRVVGFHKTPKLTCEVSLKSKNIIFEKFSTHPTSKKCFTYNIRTVVQRESNEDIILIKGMDLGLGRDNKPL